MGSAPSKAARKLPREKPSWAGARTPPSATTDLGRPLAFENKDQAIENDAKDPHFMSKLSQLGPVRVDHNRSGTQTVRAARDAQHMYHSRIRSEAEAEEASTLHSRPNVATNRLLASSLAELLEARKSVATAVEINALAARYHVDAATLTRLCGVVNTPSVDERTVVRTTDKHGEESVTMMARWVDPVLSR
ncbi:hypothetical protein JVU11DRAFT_525 [Chiua virens]|nr:hypothetical protein JVU11DRAFT_525 [Chiua virens]